MTFSTNVNNLYCPGCAPGDFAQPHICGLGNRMVSGYCYLCNVPWEGTHICLKVWQGAGTVPNTAALTTTVTPEHSHCWCLKQKAGWYDVPVPQQDHGPFRAMQKRHLKPHQVCCACGDKRVKP